MPELIFSNAQVFLGTSTAIGSTGGAFDISAFVTRVRLQRTFDLHDDTRMGHTAHSRLAGLEDWTAELDLLQDFASTSISAAQGVDKLLASVLGVKARLAIRPSAALARGVDNPEFDGPVMLENYNPMDGAVGDLLKVTVPFRSAGSLTRTTAAT